MQTAENESLHAAVPGRLSDGRRRTLSLRMAPMIDMIFLLLIFFLVAAKLRPKEDFLSFKLPPIQARDLSFGRPEPLIIHISPAQAGCCVEIGRLYTVRIENEDINAGLAVLMEKTRKCLLTQKRLANDPVEIVCEPGVKWEHLSKIYNIFFGAGLVDITFTMTE